MSIIEGESLMPSSFEFPERKKEKLESFVESLLEKSSSINRGDQGVIRKVKSELISPEMAASFAGQGASIKKGKDIVFKMLKIYTDGQGKEEFQIQKKAYDVVQEKIESGDTHFAKIAQPYLYKEMKVTEGIRKILKEDGLDTNQKKVEIILMDYILGDDFATMLYKEVVKIDGKSNKLKDIENLDFISVQDEAKKILDFTITITSMTEKNVLVFGENTERLIKYLQDNEFEFDPTIFQKLKSTIDLIHDKGICHRDLHERNIMISKVGEVYVIDFGKSEIDKECKLSEGASDDYKVIRKYKELIS